MKNRPLTTKYLAQRDFRQMVIALGPLLLIDSIIIYLILTTDYISVSGEYNVRTILSLAAVAIVAATVTPAMAGIGLLFCLLADAIVATRTKNSEQKTTERTNA